VQGIHAGVNQFGVLVFHEQHLNDEQQIAFSRQLGKLEQATGDIISAEDRRLTMELNDISNLDKNGELLPREDIQPLVNSLSTFLAMPVVSRGGPCQRLVHFCVT